MNSVTRESLNGASVSFPQITTDERVALNLTDDWDLTGDIGTDWIEPKYAPGTRIRTRKNLEPGDTFTDKEGFLRPMPMTEGNDERDLDSSFTGKPYSGLPRQDYPGTFPHTTIPYEDRKVFVSPEIGPTPSGLMPMDKLANEEERAIQAAMPFPAASPEEMARDMSGLSGRIAAKFVRKLKSKPRSRKIGLHGLGSEEDYREAAGEEYYSEEAVTQAAQEAAAEVIAENPQSAGDPSVVDKIVNTAANVALWWMRRDADPIPTPTPTTESLRLTAERTPVSEPIYKKPLFIAGALVAAAGIIYAVARKG